MSNTGNGSAWISTIFTFFGGVIPSAAAFQAERGISRGAVSVRARSLGPLVKARAFGMTPQRK
ncbi:exported hypothetical protein [Candidatus Sulfotelmatobacter kueseliae]|uniref:Uncharacterized protein n=1 Tax=Candidatus Sulfotelmatobacter kueseliae TaxID=2042962 RepID=A0A2U3JZ03_9BACT|nr:exported hypothetical protein [Candidatus Sulfotelmatobacter kueseliae]